MKFKIGNPVEVNKKLKSYKGLKGKVVGFGHEEIEGQDTVIIDTGKGLATFHKDYLRKVKR
jgi:hypothetical protein